MKRKVMRVKARLCNRPKVTLLTVSASRSEAHTYDENKKDPEQSSKTETDRENQEAGRGSGTERVSRESFESEKET